MGILGFEQWDRPPLLLAFYPSEVVEAAPGTGMGWSLHGHY